jgi:hypothetical protein
MENKGMGFRNYKKLSDYLKLTEGQSFEDADGFRWADGDMEYLMRRNQYLERKGWEDVETGKWCDTDHCVGRSQIWMNATIFTMPVSHSWNKCMSNLRILFKDWGYAFAEKSYDTGND